MSEEKSLGMIEESNEEKLVRLAGEINAIKEQTRETIRNATLAIGERLFQAKAAVPHGSWSQWLKTNVDYSERTAQMIMSTYERFGTGQQKLFGKAANPELVAQLNRSQMFALMSIKDEEACFEFMEEHREELPDMSKRELEQAIRERDEAREREKVAMIEREAIEATLKTISEEAKEAEAAAAKRLEELQEQYRELKERAEAPEKEFKVREEELKKEIESLKKKNQEADDAAREIVEKLSKENEEQEKELEQERSLKEESRGIYKKKIEKLEKELEEERRRAARREVPEETKKELESLREQVNQAKEQVEPQIRFKMIFTQTQGAFNELLAIAGKMEGEAKEKYKSACRSMVEAMKQAIDNA